MFLAPRFLVSLGSWKPALWHNYHSHREWASELAMMFETRKHWTNGNVQLPPPVYHFKYHFKQKIREKVLFCVKYAVFWQTDRPFQMHSKELQLLEVLFPCLIEFLEKVEGPKNCPERYARQEQLLLKWELLGWFLGYHFEPPWIVVSPINF